MNKSTCFKFCFVVVLFNIIGYDSETRFTLEEIFPGSVTNPERFGTGFVLPFIHRWTNPQKKKKTFRFGRVPEILNSEFKVGTLYPNTFESGKFCSVNDSLTNPNISACFSCTSSEYFYLT